MRDRIGRVYRIVGGQRSGMTGRATSAGDTFVTLALTCEATSVTLPWVSVTPVIGGPLSARQARRLQRIQRDRVAA